MHAYSVTVLSCNDRELSVIFGSLSTILNDRVDLLSRSRVRIDKAIGVQFVKNGSKVALASQPQPSFNQWPRSNG
jgi:hypothetical protein